MKMKSWFIKSWNGAELTKGGGSERNYKRIKSERSASWDRACSYRQSGMIKLYRTDHLLSLLSPVRQDVPPPSPHRTLHPNPSRTHQTGTTRRPDHRYPLRERPAHPDESYTMDSTRRGRVIGDGIRRSTRSYGEAESSSRATRR